MKSIFLLFVLIRSSLTAVIPDDKQATIINYKNSNNGNGNYEFSYETSNGLKRSESGILVNAGQADEHVEVFGEYSYYDPEGKLIVVRYVADQNGYREQPEMMPISIASPPHLVASLLG